MKTLRFKPIDGRTEDIIGAILQTEEVASCPKELYAIHLVCEEIVVNIVSYAYPDNQEGYLTVTLGKSENCLSIQFRDAGVPFNPLDQERPDITLPLEEREIGGLGIFLTQQMMDSVVYEHCGDENVLTITKCIAHEE